MAYLPDFFGAFVRTINVGSEELDILLSLIDTARNDENAISILVDWLEEYGYLTNQAFHDVRNLWGYKQDEIGDWVHTDYEVSILQLYKAMRERGMRIVPGTPEHVCEQCGNPQCEMIPCRTMYSDNSRNVSPILCKVCAKEYNDYWDERWSDYYSGQG